MSKRTLVHSLSCLSTFLLFFSLTLLSSAPTARAVPSFARQTGLACEACHTSFPELTPFGRKFKVEGYTLATTGTVGSEAENLALNATPPLSLMMQVGYTRTSKPQPDGQVDPTSGNPTNPGHTSQNGTILLPQEFSLFYAGRISPKIGAFTQITYSMQDDHFSIDNTDIRAATTAQFADSRLVYGLTVNNNPTVQDLWNTTPTWGFPFAATEIAPGPAAATLLDGPLAQQVAGIGGYLAYYMGSSMIYGEYTRYQSTQVGSPAPLDSQAGSPVIHGAAPYIRLAYEYDFGASSIEVGLLNMKANLIPAGSPVDDTPSDKVTDSGVDAQLQWVAGDQTFGIKAIQINEKTNWSVATLAAGGADNASDKLTTRRVTLSFLQKHALGLSVQSFSTTGDTDAALYGTRTGSPDTTGSVLEVAYTPWLNTRFSVQYTAYSKFDGAATDYDGSGRNAKDNNSIFALAWFMF